ncbi:MAG: hypothetical protein J7497_15345 [Chitinophagaceae bacterium]|nr:hypothetical protein [Chitinophagaceae bacterium]
MSNKPETVPGIDSFAYYIANALQFISVGAFINKSYESNANKRMIAIDIYVVLKCAIAAILLFTGLGMTDNLWQKIILAAIAIYGVVETLVALFIKIFYPKPAGKISYRRASLLLLINWLEIILWFAILYLVSSSVDFGQVSPQMFDYFYFSFLRGATMDMDNASVQGIGRIISMMQVTAFVIFITLFFSHNFGKL